VTLRSLAAAVRREASGDRALESVRAIARFHRIQASPGYDQAAEWLAGRLESIGFTPQIERVPGDGRTRFLGQLMPEGWECTRHRATLIAGEEHSTLCDEALPLSIVQRSAPAAGRYELIAIDGGSEADHYVSRDVRGRVALVRDSVHAAHRLAVIERGAAGLLVDGRRLVPPVRDRFDDPDQVAYTSFWWAGDDPRGWGFVVSPRRGDELRERLRRGERLELEVEIDSRRFATTIPLVSALLPGRSGREVLLVSHLCHPQPSANDNASGASAALETARVLHALAARGELELEHGVRFLWMPELTGTLAWLGSDPDRAGTLVAALNLDMVGEDQDRCGSTFLLERPPCFAASFAESLLARARHESLDWVQSFSGPGHVPQPRIAEVPYSGGSDHAALLDPAIGVPCPMLIQWPDRYYHSSHDTPDKCDPRSLALAVRCAATYAGFLAGLKSAERAWLLAAMEREARVRLLQTLDDEDPARAVARERVRSTQSFASLARLGLDERAIDEAQRRFVAFVRDQAPGPDPRHEARETDLTRQRPARRQRGMLDFMRHLIDGYERLGEEERQSWRDLESATPAASTFFDLAWFACNGRRTIGDIADLVALETGVRSVETLERFFTITGRLGISAWEEACSTSAPATDTH
jgi:aminopeptidase YwaD